MNVSFPLIHLWTLSYWIWMQCRWFHCSQLFRSFAVPCLVKRIGATHRHPLPPFAVELMLKTILYKGCMCLIRGSWWRSAAHPNVTWIILYTVNHLCYGIMQHMARWTISYWIQCLWYNRSQFFCILAVWRLVKLVFWPRPRGGLVWAQKGIIIFARQILPDRA